MTLEIGYYPRGSNNLCVKTIEDVFQLNYVYDEEKSSWYFVFLTKDGITYRFLLDFVDYFHIR